MDDEERILMTNRAFSEKILRSDQPQLGSDVSDLPWLSSTATPLAPEQLPLADRRRLEKYVAERGGTLILIAGKRHLPLEYVNTDPGGSDPLYAVVGRAAAVSPLPRKWERPG